MGVRASFIGTWSRDPALDAIQTKSSGDRRRTFNAPVAFIPSLLARPIRHPDITESQSPNARAQDELDLQSGEGFPTMRHASKIREFPTSEFPIRRANAFLDPCIALNITRRAQYSSASVPSGVA